MVHGHRIYYRTAIPKEDLRSAAAGRALPEAGPDSETAELFALLARLTIRRWRNYRGRIKRCRKAFSEASVHDLRISLRRLIAMLDLLRAFLAADGLKRIRRRLQKQLARLGRLRDAQIQVQYLDELEPVFPQVRDFRCRLAKQETRLIRKVKRRVKPVKARRVLRYNATRMERLPEEARNANLGLYPVLVFTEIADRAFAKVLACERQIEARDPVTIHRLRVAFKKFRYTVESLQPVLPAITDAKLKELRAFQALLGEVQDFHVLSANLDEFTGAQGRKAKQALLPVRREFQRRLNARIDKFMKARNQITTFWPL
jgi:CHAD domain-containing protein